ncbi:MAG: hypothetical protein Q8R02_16425 [Hyphomonadaceae bacterium]|nr:hypothetical protein [Hyphomonadaceae bacterium]
MRLKLLSSGLAALAFGACASDGPPASGPGAPKLDQTPIAAPRFGGGEEEAILKVVDEILLAIGNHDYAKQAEIFVGEGTTYFQRRTKATGDGPITRRMNSELSKPSPQDDPFIERYWSPSVQVRGGIAQVWAPYELRDNGQVVHCGIDAFDLVKIDGRWRIGNAVFTMEPDACNELRPPSVGDMRPKDGWKETPNQ